MKKIINILLVLIIITSSFKVLAIDNYDSESIELINKNSDIFTIKNGKIYIKFNDDTFNNFDFVVNNLEAKKITLDNEYEIYNNFKVIINYNLELLQIAAAVGSNFQHEHYVNENSELNKKIKKYFSQYKNLESAKFIYELSNNNLFSGEIYRYVSLFDITQNQNKHNIDLFNKLKSYTDKIKTVNELYKYLNDFYKETNANQFFLDNIDEYEKVINELKENINFDPIEKLNEFFGYELNNEIIFYLYTTKKGGEIYNLPNEPINIILFNPGNSIETTLNIIYHELIHAYLTGLINNYDIKLNDYEFIYKPNKLTYYSNKEFSYILNESLTRVITIINIRNHDKIISDKNIIQELNNGWKNIDMIIKFIDNNYSQKYINFKDFFPELLQFILNLKTK